MENVNETEVKELETESKEYLDSFKELYKSIIDSAMDKMLSNLDNIDKEVLLGIEVTDLIKLNNTNLMKYVDMFTKLILEKYKK